LLILGDAAVDRKRLAGADPPHFSFFPTPVVKVGLKYPSVGLVYPLAVESYDFAAKRLDAWDGRIQNLLSLYITVTLPIPLAANALKLSFASLWFVLAVAAFLGAVLSGIFGRVTGKFKAIDLDHICKGFLHYSEWEFKKEFICWAADNHTQNLSAIKRKHGIAVTMTVCFIFEILFVALWTFR
jgi:hypothetical protein